MLCPDLELSDFSALAEPPQFVSDITFVSSRCVKPSPSTCSCCLYVGINKADQTLCLCRLF